MVKAIKTKRIFFILLVIYILFSHLEFFLQPGYYSDTIGIAFSEDAYYALIVSKNIINGNGISADGITLTNGFQPLWVLIATIPYLIFTTDFWQITSILFIGILFWFLSAAIFLKIIKELLGYEIKKNNIKTFYALAFFLFLTDIKIQEYFFNGLETGLYCFMFLFFVYLWIKHWIPILNSKNIKIKYAFEIGLYSGVLFWCRNDSVFIIGISFAFYFYYLLKLKIQLTKVIFTSLIMSIVTIFISSPWLLYNIFLTGSIVPQGGLATNSGPYLFPFGIDKLSEGWIQMAKLIISPILPIGWSGYSIFFYLSFFILFIILYFSKKQINMLSRSNRCFLIFMSLATFLLASYYFLFSGATWMFQRYFMPVKILFQIFWCFTLLSFLTRFKHLSKTIVFVLIFALFFWSSYHTAKRNKYPERYMSEELKFISKLLEKEEYSKIGMFESGRLGYAYPNNIINLDGKVNKEALKAISEEKFDDYLSKASFDSILIKPFHEKWLDLKYPEWKINFTRVYDTNIKGTSMLYKKKNLK
ncbi:MAG: hypothetical protein ABIA04_04065 [Pseudomonadota bacterium]